MNKFEFYALRLIVRSITISLATVAIVNIIMGVY